MYLSKESKKDIRIGLSIVVSALSILAYIFVSILMSKFITNEILLIILLFLVSLVITAVMMGIMRKSEMFNIKDYEFVINFFDIIDNVITVLTFVLAYIGIETKKFASYKEIILLLICIKILATSVKGLKFKIDINKLK
ncbi:MULTISPECIES: hypothetical protein [Anaerococcus]|jgi:hypothetical protein|uniref:Uncharacterized protein n=1 Tax=Anaerococcus octavius TaxID=54007 RepID=A0A2I1MAU4_9FIRM|nr:MULTISPECIES: hypothetical protein [Anaerococcus]MBS6105512.1 hypothetical protein [Anaerococcus sp.]MDU3177492.1 hypothetical protein [Anaerococcus sp.]PKZ17251.1 hypothetical protein CYJ34_00660 [Anaerococcus octavius]